MAEARGGVYYSEPTDTTRGTRSYREGPPPRARAQEPRFDIAVPSWPDIDARISAFLEVERQRFEQTLAARLEEERTPLMSNGAKGPPLELRDLFKQFIADTR
jgi:hypothetical protein